MSIREDNYVIKRDWKNHKGACLEEKNAFSREGIECDCSAGPPGGAVQCDAKIMGLKVRDTGLQTQIWESSSQR